MKGSEDKIRSIETAEEMVKKAAYMGGGYYFTSGDVQLSL